MTSSIDARLPDALFNYKNRADRDLQDLLTTLIYLAGDIDRYVQAKDADDGVALQLEEGNIRTRLRELHAQCGHAPTVHKRVRCRFCRALVPKETAHRHQKAWVGDACCWDERLRSTE